MYPFKKISFFTLLTLLITACGGGSTSSDNSTESPLIQDSNSSNTTTVATVVHTIDDTLTPSTLQISLDNRGNKVQKFFNKYKIQILSDKILKGSDEISQETIAVYGTINGEETKALLKINSHYRESNLTIEIYRDEQLVAIKEALSFTNQIAVDFGHIEIKEGEDS